MKKQIWKIIGVITMFGLSMLSCDNELQNSNLSIESKYRFENGTWYNSPNRMERIGEVTVSENSITTTTANINIFNVYTMGGGKFSGGNNFNTGTWTYLYDNNGKIGVALVYNNGSKDIILGKSVVESANAGLESSNYSNMQDIYKGFGASVN